MDKMITIYGMRDCSDCKRAKALLQSKQIVYKEFWIEEDQKVLDYALSINGGVMITPTIQFPDGSVLVEPDNEQLEKKLKKINLLS